MASVTAAARKLGIEVPPLQSSPRSGKGSNERYRARVAARNAARVFPAKGKTHGDHANGSRGPNPARNASQVPAQSAQTAAPSTGRVSA